MKRRKSGCGSRGQRGRAELCNFARSIPARQDAAKPGAKPCPARLPRPICALTCNNSHAKPRMRHAQSPSSSAAIKNPHFGGTGWRRSSPIPAPGAAAERSLKGTALSAEFSGFFSGFLGSSSGFLGSSASLHPICFWIVAGERSNLK